MGRGSDCEIKWYILTKASLLSVELIEKKGLMGNSFCDNRLTVLILSDYVTPDSTIWNIVVFLQSYS